MEDETPPHEKPEWKKIIQETQDAFFENQKRLKDPLHGGRPREILVAPRPELKESFYYWSLQLAILLNPKYIKRRPPEFIDNKEYDNVAFEIGERCLRLLPNARDNLQNSPNKQIDNERYAFQENEGLARYAELLIKYDRLEEALFVCEQCIEYGIHDGTKTGFSGRAEKIRNKIAKQNPKPKQDQIRAKGTLNDDQILELVAKYMSSSSEDRQLLPAEYGITRTNLYYIVSKNKHRLEKSND